MEHIAPLLQTLLWVALITGLAFRFHSQIGRILDALGNRVEKGASIKAGPFELGNELQPQNSEQQKDNLQAEILEISESPSETQALVPQVDLGLGMTTISKYIQAEDLALRAIQSEFKVSIQRQLQSGDIGVDGYFHANGVNHLIEVKYSSIGFKSLVLDQAIRKLRNRFIHTSTGPIRIILALVFDNESVDIAAEQKRRQQRFDEYQGLVEVRCYSLPELVNRFFPGGGLT